MSASVYPTMPVWKTKEERNILVIVCELNRAVHIYIETPKYHTNKKKIGLKMRPIKIVARLKPDPISIHNIS